MSKEHKTRYWCYALNKYFDEMSADEQIQLITKKYTVRIDDGKEYKQTPIGEIGFEYKGKRR